MEKISNRPKMASDETSEKISMLDKYSFQEKSQPKTSSTCNTEHQKQEIPQRNEKEIVDLSNKFGIKANENKVEKKEEKKSRVLCFIFRH